MSEETSNAREVPQRPDGLELLCVGVMRSEFGRRESQALEKAMLRLAAETALRAPAESASPNLWTRIHAWLGDLPPNLRLALAGALVMLIGLGSWLLWSGKLRGLKGAPDPALICKISDALDARWAANTLKPKIGDTLKTGELRLETGVVELTYFSGAQVAVEGPAQFKLSGLNSLELQSGKLSAEISRRARGFSVKTPSADLVDLGTRFGVTVNSSQASEVDVFQGRVELTAPGNGGTKWQLTPGRGMIVDAKGAVEVTALPEAAFPQVNRVVLARPQNCGFDASGRAVTGGVPADFGYWSGPAFALTGPVLGVRTVEGAGMLQFHDSEGGDSEVWQLIDLRPFKKLLASGAVEAKFSAMFNRIAGEARAGDKFGLTLAAFRGLPTDPKSLWLRRDSAAVAVADKELTSDNDPATWEKIEVAARLPEETDFAIVQIRAVSPKGARASALFPGHFADLVELKLCTPMRASSLATSR